MNQESNILLRKMQERPKMTSGKPELGEQVDTDEEVVVYRKEHLQRIWKAGLRESYSKKKSVTVAQGIRRLKPFSLIGGLESHSYAGRKFFKDACFIVLAVTASRKELNFFNHYEDDVAFAGYCYSVKLNKLLRVYGDACYKTEADGDLAEKMGANVEREREG